MPIQRVCDILVGLGPWNNLTHSLRIQRKLYRVQVCSLRVFLIPSNVKKLFSSCKDNKNIQLTKDDKSELDFPQTSGHSYTLN